MKFEIGNPSDQCFLEADDAKVAVACILFLGNGQYFCKNVETDESIAGAFFALGGDVEETWKHFHGIGFEEFISKPETKNKMAEGEFMVVWIALITHVVICFISYILIKRN